MNFTSLQASVLPRSSLNLLPSIDNIFINISKPKKISYTRMQAILWVTNGLNFPGIIQEHAISALVNYIRNSNHQLYFINCKNISEIDDHALDKLFAINK